MKCDQLSQAPTADRSLPGWTPASNYDQKQTLLNQVVTAAKEVTKMEYWY